MPNYLVVMKWETVGDKRVSKSMPFKDQASADAHIAAHIGNFPDAFVVVDPPGQATNLIVDPVAKTVSSNQKPRKIEEVRDEKYREADAEFVKRSLIAAEANTPGLGKVRGGQAKDRLTAISIKSTGVLRAALAAVHDKLDILKDAIEVDPDPASIDPTDDIHWI